ncbi:MULTISPECIES: hypothetical protein [unclassified Streptomyces]|nr:MULTISPECIES: hypothetical protein [unclassified Streptomyces]MBT2407933.1 hypothetical protein [Streptomyces sp. ISL-21]MBT2608617.1 hypothetical protein [Streptomyces sp. ISL-87]
MNTADGDGAGAATAEGVAALQAAEYGTETERVIREPAGLFMTRDATT